jgi:Family of unknown function (DUF5995)
MRTRLLLAAASGAVAAVVALGSAPTAPADDPPFVEWTSLLPGLVDEYTPTSENDCVAGRERCVDAVIREMTKRYEPLADACDHDAIFALSYLRTTEEYKRTSAEADFFEDRPFVNHEDVVFAKLYFDARDSWRKGQVADVPEAWRIAFDAARERRVSAAGDLYLGINAHVQRDLPFALYRIGLVKPDGTSRKHDHDRVNVFLNRVTDGLIAEIAQRFDPTVDDSNLPGWADDTALFQSIAAWRELAWRNAERLATAPTDAARAIVADQIESAAAQSARTLVLATQYPPLLGGSAARDAYCAAQRP